MLTAAAYGGDGRLHGRHLANSGRGLLCDPEDDWRSHNELCSASPILESTSRAHIMKAWSLERYPVVQKLRPIISQITRWKMKRFLIISVYRILKKFDAQLFMPLSTTPEKTSQHLPWEMQKSFTWRSYIISSTKWMALKIAGYHVVYLPIATWISHKQHRRLGVVFHSHLTMSAVCCLLNGLLSPAPTADYV